MHTRDGFRPQRAACPSIIQVKISAVLLQNIFDFFSDFVKCGGSPSRVRAHALERKLSFWEPFLVGGIRWGISFPPFFCNFFDSIGQSVDRSCQVDYRLFHFRAALEAYASPRRGYCLSRLICFKKTGCGLLVHIFGRPKTLVFLAH